MSHFARIEVLKKVILEPKLNPSYFCRYFKKQISFQELIDDSSETSASSTTPTTSSSPIPGLKPDSRPGSRLNHQASPFHQSHRSNSPMPELPEKPRNVVHIVTKDFPQYFALISRPRQDIATVGPEGAILVSSRISKAQVYHKPK